MVMLIDPARYTLNDQQIAAAVQLAGVTAGPRSSLPDASGGPDPERALKGSAALGRDGTLEEGLKVALGVLAAPTATVSLSANVAGATEATESQIICGAPDGPYVGTSGPDRWDLALLPTLTDAVLYADEMLAITAGLSQVGEAPVSLGLAGLAAFAAFGDAVLNAKLQALLARQQALQSTWTTAELQDFLSAGLAHEDTRWATTAIRQAAPVPFGDGAAPLGDGLKELARLGLVTTSGDAWTLTPAGYTRAAAFGQLVNVGAISRITVDASGQPTVASASVFRTVLGVWLLTWNTTSDGARVDLEEVTAGRALELVRTLLRGDA
ncbi:MAG: hypothetical protein EPO65_01780 [Dehalococcoidia bacterium]|nr:MAG: hypothetical protein EPO65_01780 [Dehalococcoidia bacterium]